MASSYIKTVEDNATEAIVQEFSKTASGSGSPTWRIFATAGTNIATTATPSYSGSSITFTSVELTIPAGRTVTAIGMEYDDGTGYVTIDNQPISAEEYTYEGKYIVTTYEIELTRV